MKLALLPLLFSLSLAAYADPMDLPAPVREAFTKAGLPLLREKRQSRDFTLETLEGGSVTLSGLKGKVVFLNFWATWCGPCRVEMPGMEALHRRYREEGLEFVAVDIMENAAQVRNFLKDNNYTFPVLLDLKGSVSSGYGIQAVPSTYILDRDGKIIFFALGARNWDTPAIFAAFESLLRNGR
ncbi:MAG: TlpA family protein disulfide reductase [Treponema sp.]|nr:TlpA family protein disulfide reductase [Treponema sp.]